MNQKKNTEKNQDINNTEEGQNTNSIDTKIVKMRLKMKLKI